MNFIFPQLHLSLIFLPIWISRWHQVGSKRSVTQFNVALAQRMLQVTILRGWVGIGKLVYEPSKSHHSSKQWHRAGPLRPCLGLLLLFLLLIGLSVLYFNTCASSDWCYICMKVKDGGAQWVGKVESYDSCPDSHSRRLKKALSIKIAIEMLKPQRSAWNDHKNHLANTFHAIFLTAFLNKCVPARRQAGPLWLKCHRTENICFSKRWYTTLTKLGHWQHSWQVLTACTEWRDS